jgi:hypothetical protein
VGKPLWLQVLLGSIAFPVWAYALAGPFVTTPAYEPFIGSLLLILATFLFGLVEPNELAAGTIRKGVGFFPTAAERTGARMKARRKAVRRSRPKAAPESRSA